MKTNLLEKDLKKMSNEQLEELLTHCHPGREMPGLSAKTIDRIIALQRRRTIDGHDRKEFS
jgi:hypothetical protein